MLAQPTSAGGSPRASMPADIDIANAAALGTQLRAAVPNDAPGLAVDLSATRYLDSAGIEMLLALGEQLRRRRQEVRLVVPSASPLRRLLTLTGVDRVLAIDEPTGAAAPGPAPAGEAP